MTIIKYYHINIKNLSEIELTRKSVGVSQYGIEAGMPHGNGISSVVENEAIRQIEDIKFWSDIITDIKYLQDRWHRITDQRESRILSLRLDGLTLKEIASIEGMDRTGVYKTLVRICSKLSTGD